MSDPAEPQSPPLPTEQAIRLARIGIRRGAAVRWLLILMASTGIVIGMLERTPSIGPGLAIGAAFAWVMLVTRSIRRQQGLQGVPMLIEAHQPERADRIIADSLRAFSIFRAPRVQALQHLASIRLGQHRPQDASALAGELLRYRLSPPTATAMRLLQAETALEMNDLLTAHAALSSLQPPATLAESIKLMQLQTDYCIRAGAWTAALDNLPWKVELAELLPSDLAAWVQAMLALAAMKAGMVEWRNWLQRRAELLCDRAALIARQPLLAQLFE